jgi:hypothetical protein
MKKMKMALASVAVVLSVGLVVVLPACKKSNDGPSIPEVVQVATVDAAPKVPYFDVHVNGSKFANRVAYLDQAQTATVSYSLDTLNGGNLNLRLTDSLNNDIVEGGIAALPYMHYTLLVYDTLSGNVKQTKTLLLSDNLAFPGKNMSKVRFLNLSPGAPAVDVDLISGKDSIRVTTTADYVGDNPNTVSLSAFIKLVSANYHMKVKTKSSGKTIVLFDDPSLLLTGGKIFTVYLKGLGHMSNKYRESIQVIQHN